MVASLWGSVGAGTKEDESSTGRDWAAGFRYVTARSHLTHFETHEPFISLILYIFFRAAANRGYGGPPVYGLWYTYYTNTRSVTRTMASHYDAVTKQPRCAVSNSYTVHSKENLLLRRKSLLHSVIDEQLC